MFSLKTYLCALMFFSCLMTAQAQPFLNLTIADGGKGKAGNRADIINSAKPCQLILVLDGSGSMDEDQKMSELNAAVQALFQGIQQDPPLMQKLEVGVVSFESGARVLRQPALLSGRESAPQLTATGSTNMSAGAQTASSLLRGGELQPIVIMITDGQPDNSNSAVQAIQQIQPKAHFYALGVQGADFAFLQQVAGPQQAGMLAQTKFSGFFQDMKMAIEQYIMSSSPMGIRMGMGNPFRHGINISNRSGWRAY